MAGEWITRITDAAKKAGMLGAAGLSPAVGPKVADGAEVEAALLKLKAVTRPDDWDGVLDECLRRAAHVWVLDAVESVFAGAEFAQVASENPLVELGQPGWLLRAFGRLFGKGAA